MILFNPCSPIYTQRLLITKDQTNNFIQQANQIHIAEPSHLKCSKHHLTKKLNQHFSDKNSIQQINPKNLKKENRTLTFLIEDQECQRQNLSNYPNDKNYLLLHFTIWLKIKNEWKCSFLTKLNLNEPNVETLNISKLSQNSTEKSTSKIIKIRQKLKTFDFVKGKI